MLFRDFLDPGDPILRWRSFFRCGGRISQREYWEASRSIARWTYAIALVLVVLEASIGSWVGGSVGFIVGIVAGILTGALVQAIPTTTLQIRRLHDFGWSAAILIAPLFAIIVPMLLLAAIATKLTQLETLGPWLIGCVFLGVAAYIALGSFLLFVKAPGKENRFGPPPSD